MPSSRTHLIIGLSAWFILIFVLTEVIPTLPRPGSEGDYVAALIYLFSCLVGSVVPDWIEPARDPNHRGFFHSLFGLVIVILFIGHPPFYEGVGDFISTQIGAGAGEIYYTLLPLIFWLLLGYILHLIADLFTPRGLPPV